MTVKPFEIRIDNVDIADLKERLRRARWPDAISGRAWDDGADVRYMRELCAYWADRFDWRAQERRLNSFPQFTAKVSDSTVHFIHARGKGPNPLPVILTHGWPSSFAELTKLIPLLTDPDAHGGAAADSFDVVVPSMPGYGFSSRPARSGMNTDAVADIWVALMSDVLGYDRFVAQGGDFGGWVTNQIGRKHGERVAAIHALCAPNPDLVDNPSESERGYIATRTKWHSEEGGYAHQQRSKPQTLSIGLNDSPVGLAAWIVEKWRNWSDCGGDIESSFTKDELLANISIYWFTQTISSSVRMYYEYAHTAAQSAGEKIKTPARLFLTKEPVDLCPPEWAHRSYANLSYGLASKGGHFLAAEEPKLLADDMREWFRAFR